MDKVVPTKLHSGSWMTPPVIIEVSQRTYNEIASKITKSGDINKFKRHDSILDISHTYLDQHGQRCAYRSKWLIEIGDGIFLLQKDPGPPKTIDDPTKTVRSPV